ncbi:MAG: hypothetical protein WEC15_00110 [Flavobacteriales bacterium]
MNRGILFASIIAFAWSGLGLACRNPANEAQIRTVDSMITSLEAAKLTLNELDRIRYDRAAALYRSDSSRFIARFADTLDRSTAERLGNHFRVLRAAANIGADHSLVGEDLASSKERLLALRNDMENGALNEEGTHQALLNETRIVDALDGQVQQVIVNYRAVQRAWDDLATVDSLLAASPRNTQLP